MYQTCNDEDEFEPRVTPKPASKFDCFAVPSVPEVSLVFDKPLSRKAMDYKGFHSSSIESKGLMHKNNIPSPLSTNGSYAAWKEQNYSRRPATSQFNNSATHQRVQCSQNYIAESYLPEDALIESKGRNYTLKEDLYSSPTYKEQQMHRGNNDSFNKRTYQMCKDNTMCNEKKQNMKTQSNNTIKHIDSASTVPQAVKACINIDNYAVNEKEYSPLLYERKLITHNPEQKIPFNDLGNEPTVQNLTINPNTLKRNEIQLPHYLGQQYPYFNANGYPFPQLHSCSTHNTDSQETVKNLLQIINSQNEQIKSLQTQVDRLLKMQEENIKEKKSCFCSSQLQQQNDQLFVNSSDNTIGTSSYVRVPKNTKRYTSQCEQSKDKEKENSSENESVNQTDLILQEAQSRKTFMEQKVSIGVMTSFEFTVQNSPFSVDMEDYERKDTQQETGNLKMCNSVGLHDTNESLRRYKNSFTRMPSAQLENIVEDSESYMSSSQQQSSNLNASASIKDLEKHAYTDTRRETDARRSESPKLCKNTTTKLNQTEATQKHLDRINKEGVKNYGIIKTPVIQKHSVEHNAPTNSNHKANIPTNTDQYIKLNMQRDNDSVKTSNSVNRSTDYYKDYQKERQVAITKRASCIEDSLILNGGDLKINERPPPTPEPSIHVEMQEYSSDDDSEKIKCSSKVGWTFYNNVLGQVNQLLQNSCVIDDQQQDQKKVNQNERDETENRALDTVKVATLEQLKKLGISLSENPEHKELNNSNKMAFDLSFYPRLDYQANMTQATSAVNETNTSMHMKALALKYLSDEQLAELAVQRQGSASVKHLMVSNVQGTNMSFATMRYLERYQLLPGKNTIQTEDISKVQVEVPPKVDSKLGTPKNNPALQRFPFNQTPRTTCPSKILDISTLKQQPKLL